MPKTYVARSTRPLWGAVRIWALLFMGAAALSAGVYAYRAVLLSQIHSDLFLMEGSELPGHPEELWMAGIAGIAYLATYIGGAFVVLMWFLRSVRNGHALGLRLETSPKWVIWFFIIPLVSLFKPYAMASELWRSSASPGKWKGADDPVMLRCWWAAVLGSGFVTTVGDLMSRTANTPGPLIGASVVFIVGYLLQIAAGVLFLRIGGAISQRQSLLIDSHVFSDTPETIGQLA
jgi:hypothetical protein